MRIESRVVAVSWIPSEAVTGSLKAPFELGITHYDEPLPDVLGDLEDWRAAGPVPLRQRPAGLDRGGRRRRDRRATATPAAASIGSTTMRLGECHRPPSRRSPPRPPGGARGRRRLGAVPPDGGRPHRRARPAAGGQAPLRAVPRPDRVDDALAHDPRRRHASTGSSSAPARSPATGSTTPTAKLAAKAGLADFKDWYRHAFGEHTPWGDEDSPALVTAVETALERQLSRVIMGEGKPKIRKLKEGAALIEQGEEADEIYLLLDGVLQVDVDGEEIAELGPGALIGERAVLEGGRRTATLIAVSPCKVAEARKVELDLDKLAEVSEGHRREETADRVKVHVLGVRGSTPAPGHAFARHGGNTSCVALAHDGEAPEPRARRRHGPPGPRRAARRGARSAARCSSGTSTGTTPRGCRSPAPSTTTAPRCGCACRSRRMATPPSTCCAGPCRRRTSRSARRGCAGAWTFEGLEPGFHHIDGFEVLALEIPHKGGRTFGYRVSDGHAADRLPVRPRPRRRSARVRTAGGRTTTPRWRWPTGVDLLIHDAQHTADELPARVAWGHSAADYPVRLARAGRCQGRAAVPPRPHPHRRRGRRHRRRLRGTPACPSRRPPRARSSPSDIVDSMTATGWLIGRHLRRRWATVVIPALIVALGTGSALIALGAAVRTDGALRPLPGDGWRR